MKPVTKHALAAVILVFCVAAPAVAGPFEDGTDAFSRGDYATALQKFVPLAIQDNARAQYNVGLMFSNGYGVPQSYESAAIWYRKAADQGFDMAQHNLGLLYFNGRGVPQDYVSAHMWLNLALDAGARDMVAKKMTPAQIAEAQKLAREWKPK